MENVDRMKTTRLTGSRSSLGLPLLAPGGTLPVTVVAALAVVLILLVLAVAPGCSDDSASGSTSLDTPTSLAGVEIREYEGAQLSSVGEFRENSISGPQRVNLATYRLQVTGLVESPLSLAYDDVIGRNQRYTKVVTLDCVEGWSVTILWEGVLVRDLLESAGVKPEARIAIFKCHDGYTTSLDLDFLLSRDILLAHKANGLALAPERGFPFQLVAEEKWGYKWAKWVTEIELSADVDYEGYWEQYGYSRDGSIERPFFGD